MIGWMLRRLEKNPRAAFLESELVNKGSSDFASLRSAGLIRRLTGLRAGDSIVDLEGRLLTVVTALDGSLAGIDEDDQSFDEVPLPSQRFTAWQVDIDVVASKLARGSGVSGASGWLDDRLYQAGELSAERAVILAFLPDDTTGIRLLKTIRSFAAAKYNRFEVLTPSWTCPVAQRRPFELDGTFVTTLDDGDLFHVDFGVHGTNEASTAPEFEFRDGFRWVKIRGREFSLPVVAAKVVEVLYRAHNEGRPDVPWKTIASQVMSHPKSMSEVFKTVPDWKQLIKTTRRDLYRLNLSEPSMSSSG